MLLNKVGASVIPKSEGSGDRHLRKVEKVQNMDSVLELGRPWRRFNLTTHFTQGFAKKHTFL